MHALHSPLRVNLRIPDRKNSAAFWNETLLCLRKIGKSLFVCHLVKISSEFKATLFLISELLLVESDKRLEKCRFSGSAYVVSQPRSCNARA